MPVEWSVGLRARAPHRADDVLQRVDVVVAEDRADDLSAVLAAAQRAIGDHLPGAPVLRGDADVAVVVGDGAPDHAVNRLGELHPAQAHRFDLNPESQRLHRLRPRVARGVGARRVRTYRLPFAPLARRNTAMSDVFSVAWNSREVPRTANLGASEAFVGLPTLLEFSRSRARGARG